MHQGVAIGHRAREAGGLGFPGTLAAAHPRPAQLVVGSAGGPPALDMAVSHALLRAVAGGRGACLRVYRPQPTLAFGRRDAQRPGFEEACAAARARGYEPVLRLAGGHAAAYDGGCVIVEQILPAAELAVGLHDRFDRAVDLVLDRLEPLGVDLRVGEIPGEYCPGAHSISIAGLLKIAGVAQRVIQGAALVSTVLVVGPVEPIDAVIGAVYDALGLTIDRRVTGGLQDAVPGLAAETVLRSFVGDGVAQTLDDELLVSAGTLLARHRL